MKPAMTNLIITLMLATSGVHATEKRDNDLNEPPLFSLKSIQVASPQLITQTEGILQIKALRERILACEQEISNTQATKNLLSSEGHPTDSLDKIISEYQETINNSKREILRIARVMFPEEGQKEGGNQLNYTPIPSEEKEEKSPQQDVKKAPPIEYVHADLTEEERQKMHVAYSEIGKKGEQPFRVSKRPHEHRTLHTFLSLLQMNPAQAENFSMFNIEAEKARLQKRLAKTPEEKAYWKTELKKAKQSALAIQAESAVQQESPNQSPNPQNKSDKTKKHRKKDHGWKKIAKKGKQEIQRSEKRLKKNMRNFQ
jgi:hypothetical protein